MLVSTSDGVAVAYNNTATVVPIILSVTGVVALAAAGYFRWRSQKSQEKLQVVVVDAGTLEQYRSGVREDYRSGVRTQISPKADVTCGTFGTLGALKFSRLKIEKMPRAAKTKKSPKKKDPNAPKRALSAFMLFSQEKRMTIKKENPDATFGQIGKLLGDAWKNATDEEKAPFLAKAEKEKEKYTEAMAAYKSKGSSAKDADDEEEEDED